MQLSDEGAADIARFEGAVNHLYNDALFHCSIGIGHLVHEGPCDGSEPDQFRRGLSDAEMWDLFRTDAAVYVDAVNRLVTVDLTQRQFDALVDFAFNWGIGETGGFPATSVLLLINAGDFTGAAYELVHGRGPITDRWPQGRPYDKGLAGVRARRIENAAAFQEVQMTPAEIIRRAMADCDADGVPVVWIDGWEDRGRPWDFDPQGAVWHHTATRGYGNDYPSLGIVRDGRSDLPGPLSQFGIGRHTGAVYVIAAGYSNHAGGGGWNGLSGNGSVWGTECENDGVGEAWAEVSLRSQIVLAAALGRHTGYDVSNNCDHREWTDAKIDRTGVDSDQFRADVAAFLADDTDQEATMSQYIHVVIPPGASVTVSVPIPNSGDVGNVGIRFQSDDDVKINYNLQKGGGWDGGTKTAKVPGGFEFWSGWLPPDTRAMQVENTHKKSNVTALIHIMPKGR